VSVYGTLVEDKMRRFKGECAHFSFSKCYIYTHDVASANFSTNSHETDNSAVKPIGFLFFVISISGSKHVKNPNIYIHQPEEVSGLFQVVESLDMEDLKLAQLLVNIST
jgi:hypothetical protein